MRTIGIIASTMLIACALAAVVALGRSVPDFRQYRRIRKM